VQGAARARIQRARLGWSPRDRRIPRYLTRSLEQPRCRLSRPTISFNGNMALIVRRHSRRFLLHSSSPRYLAVLSVSALDCSFSFVFFNPQHSSPPTFKRSRSTPVTLLSFADPHPINPVASIFYENSGRGKVCLSVSCPFWHSRSCQVIMLRLFATKDF
jgi:hypothetical protein